MSVNRLGGLPRRLLDLLGSGRLAVVLLVATSCLLYLYLVVPQSGQVGERALVGWLEQRGVAGDLLHRLGLTDVLHTWLFWSVYGLLLVNLSVCMTRRLSLVARLCRLPDRPPHPGAGWQQREIGAGGVTAEQVAATLRRDGYRTLVARESVYGLRGRFASIGHWVFHAGLLAILIVGGWLAVEWPPFGGTVGVGEGEPFDLHTARLVSANQEVDSELAPLRFRVEKVDVLLEPQGVKQFDVSLSSAEDEATLSINRPYRDGPYQVLVHGFGFMPGWMILNARGRIVGSAWLKLLPVPLQEQESFSLGPGESTAYVRFYPDHALENEQDLTLSQDLRNPRFRTRVVWRGEQVYDGLLAPGERVPLGEGKEFFFLPEIRRYALLDVIEERGQTAVFSCFGIMTVGLLVRYGRTRKEIVVSMGEHALRLHGRAEIFEHLFAEDLTRLAGELEELSGVPAGAPDEGEVA